MEVAVVGAVLKVPDVDHLWILAPAFSLRWLALICSLAFLVIVKIDHESASGLAEFGDGLDL